MGCVPNYIHAFELYRSCGVKTDLERIKQLPILDVAKRLGIEIKGSKALCFKGHDQKTLSLSFNVKENYWHCFGCGIGGNTLDLVRAYLDISFKDALHWFQDTEGIYRHKTLLKKGRKENSIANAPDSEIYEWLINSIDLSKEGFAYLTKIRGYSTETILYFNIKDINNPPKKFKEAVNLWGVERLIKCGLAKKMSSGENCFVWWDHIILFPFYNERNRITNIQGRQFRR